MRLFIITALFFLLMSPAIAKDTTSVHKRFAIGINLSPDYSFRRLTMVTQNIGTLSLFEHRIKSEIPSFGYTGGVSLSYYFKEQFSASLGVNFSQKGFSTESMDVITPDHPETAIGRAQFRYNYNYIEIPVQAQYMFGKKKIRLLTCAGLSPAFLLYKQAIIKIEYYNGEKARERDQPNYINNPFNLFLNIGAGTDITLRENVGLRILPTFNYGLLRTGSVRITENLWNAGLTFGCYIRL